MSRVLIVPLGLVFAPNWQASINAFATLGVWKMSVLLNWPKANGIINQYRAGGIDSAQFRQQISTLFPQINQHSKKKFWQAWNQCCGFDEKSLAVLTELQELETAGAQIYLMGRTNRAHVNFIQKKVNGNLPGTLFLSYQQKTIGPELTQKLMTHIQKEHPELEAKEILHLCVVPKTKPFPNLWLGFGWLRWVFAPFAMLSYQAEQRAFSAIQAQGPKLGFQLLQQPQTQTLQAFLKTWRLSTFHSAVSSVSDKQKSDCDGCSAKSGCEQSDAVDIEDLFERNAYCPHKDEQEKLALSAQPIDDPGLAKRKKKAGAHPKT